MSGEDDVTFGYRKGYAAAMAEAERDIEALRVEVDAWRATAHAAADQRDTWHRRATDALKLLDEVAPALATGGGEPEAPPEPEPIRSVGEPVHGIECFEAWRSGAYCPHEPEFAAPEATTPGDER